MPVYVITYDLDAPGQDYTALVAALRSAGAVRFQYSSWLIETRQGAADLRDALKSYMDRNDRVFVAEITPSADWAAYRMMEPSGSWLLARRA